MSILSEDKFLMTLWQDIEEVLFLRKASSFRNEIRLQMDTFS